MSIFYPLSNFHNVTTSNLENANKCCNKSKDVLVFLSGHSSPTLEAMWRF